MLELPVLRHVRRLILIVLLYGILVLLTIWAPVRTFLQIKSERAPFTFFTNHVLELLLFTIWLPLVYDRWNISKVFRGIVDVSIKAAVRSLGIANYMLPPEPGQPLPLPAQLYPQYFVYRIGSFVLLSVLASYMFVTGGLVVPLLIGRRALCLLFDYTVNEIYSFSAGLGLLTVGVKLILYVRAWKTEPALASLSHMVTWLLATVIFVVKFFLASVMLGALLPLFVGLFLDCMFFSPLKLCARLLTVHMSPVVNVWQSWALGVMALKLLHQAALKGMTSLTSLL